MRTSWITSGDFDAPGRTGFVARALAFVAPIVRRLALDGVTVDAAPMSGAEGEAVVLSGARSAFTAKGPAIVLEIAGGAVEVALEVPAAARALDADVRAAIAALPPPFAIAPRGEEGVPLSATDADEIGARALRAHEERRAFRIALRVARDAALADLTLDERLEAAIVALAGPFSLVERDQSPSPRVIQGPRVRVRSGPFAGRVGVLQGFESDGTARVLLGLLATRLAASEVELVGARSSPAAKPAVREKRPGRPALGSSHRSSPRRSPPKR